MTTYTPEDRETKSSLDELKMEQEMMRENVQRKRLETFWWAAVLIWAGIVFAADSLNLLPQIREESAWSWIFLGAGAFGLAGALIRTANLELPRPTGWDYFWAAIFLMIGASGFFGGGIVFPITLLVLGVATLANVLFRQK